MFRLLRKRVWRGVLLAIAVTGMVTSYSYYANGKTRLNVGLDNLRTCRAIAAKIHRARQAPQRATLKTRSVDDFGSVVEKAAADARLARDRVLRIDPQPAKRIGKTDYLEQATEIELLAVNLTQLVDFVLRLATTDDQLTIHTLRLRPPHESTTTSNEELWLADVVLTQRIYSPATPDR